MKQIFNLSCFLFFTIIIFSSLSPNNLYGQTGKLSGRITDSKTGEGLPFVNVIIENSTFGAATDIDGYYAILNLRPDIYSVKVSAIGYQSQTVENVKVSIDLTTKIDLSLSEASLELGEEVIVVATRPMVTKDLTASTAIVGADDFAKLPVTEFAEVLSLKAGIVGNNDGFNVRGGRGGEVSYLIDGVPVTDAYDGSTVIDVAASSIQELQFVSGAFNAEYGKALSGIINLSTKEGNNDFNATVTSYIGDYYSDKTEKFTDIDNFEPTAIRNIEGSFSGPIIPNKLYFYGNARYIYFDGWYKGVEIYKPWDITYFDENEAPENQYTFEQTGSGDIIPMNWSERVYLQGKLTYHLLSNLKVNFNYMNDRTQYKDYDHNYKYNPSGIAQQFRKGHSNILTITHTLGSSTFYQASGSYFFKKYERYVYSDVNDSRWVHNKLTSQQPQNGFSFYTGGQDNTMFERITKSLSGKFDITSQITRIHQIKGGIEFNQNSVYSNDVTLLQYIDGYFNGTIDPNLVNGKFDQGEDGIPDPDITGYPYVSRRIPDINDPEENLSIMQFDKTPIEFSAYLQDKIELNEMIVNIGVRFDYFDSDGSVVTDLSDPDIYRPRRPENIAKTLDERRQYWYKKADPKFQLSPRLGVAFPITDRGVIHFSYGHFFQIPNYELLYRNSEYKLAVGGENIGIVGNADLKPEQTISGELGLQQAFTDDISIDITGYFRDIKDLTGTRADIIRLFGGSGSYSQLVNSDFGFVKGIIFSVSKRFSNNWSGSLDYTLQSAKGNASDPNAVADQRADGVEAEVQLVPLNWDQTHTASVTFSYTQENWGFSFIGQYGSGFPYTPSQSENQTKILTNSLLKPSSFNADLRAYYDIVLGDFRFSIFGKIYNIFDISNEDNVYDDSGTADYTLSEQLRRIEGSLELVNSISEYYRNPTYYSEPRRIELGVSIYY